LQERSGAVLVFAMAIPVLMDASVSAAKVGRVDGIESGIHAYFRQKSGTGAELSMTVVSRSEGRIADIHPSRRDSSLQRHLDLPGLAGRERDIYRGLRSLSIKQRCEAVPLSECSVRCRSSRQSCY